MAIVFFDFVWQLTTADIMERGWPLHIGGMASARKTKITAIKADKNRSDSLAITN
jgi:hypothetical protein